MLNLELLEQIRDQILFEPERHEQASWMTVGADVEPGDTVACATSACVAGWACLLSGDKAVVSEDRFIESAPAPAAQRILGLGRDDFVRQYVANEVLDEDGVKHDIEVRAADLLGVDVYDSDDDAEHSLFDWNLTHEQVLNRLDSLIARAKEEHNAA